MNRRRAWWFGVLTGLAVSPAGAEELPERAEALPVPTVAEAPAQGSAQGKADPGQTDAASEARLHPLNTRETIRANANIHLPQDI